MPDFRIKYLKYRLEQCILVGPPTDKGIRLDRFTKERIWPLGNRPNSSKPEPNRTLAEVGVDETLFVVYYIVGDIE